jgi:hypothetical protein
MMAEQVLKRQRTGRCGRPLARAITPFELCAGEKCGLPGGILWPDLRILPYSFLLDATKSNVADHIGYGKNKKR